MYKKVKKPEHRQEEEDRRKREDCLEHRPSAEVDLGCRCHWCYKARRRSRSSSTIKWCRAIQGMTVDERDDRRSKAADNPRGDRG